MGLKQQFRIKEGKHSFRDPETNLVVTRKKGSIIASETNLADTFPEKFEKVHKDEDDISGGAVERFKKIRDQQQVEVPADEPEEEQEETGIQDVSAKFEALQLKGYTVLYDGEKFTVKRRKKTLVKNLETKKDVMNWYREYKAAKDAEKEE